ncbi:MAG: hypothetical protein SGJ27_17610 [Candidatus Melainabacteria bacterium]|nr:hypothetical protein [Candidatus Melainabacteria bacterium]
MDTVILAAAGTSPAIAGLWFIVGFVVGLFAVGKFGFAMLWPSIIAIVVFSLIRGFSPALELVAIASVSIVHVAVGCLTVLILKSTQRA